MLELGVLIERVARRTHGTPGDPLTREDVAQVVRATVTELGRAHDADELDLTPGMRGNLGTMTETPETPEIDRERDELQPERERPGERPDEQPHPEADPTAPEPGEPTEA